MQISSPENNQFIHRLSGGIVALTIAFVAGIVFFVSALPAQAATTTIYVNASAGGANNGTSWADAYTSLEAALDDGAIPPGAGDDVQIWVAAGTYTPGAARLDTLPMSLSQATRRPPPVAVSNMMAVAARQSRIASSQAILQRLVPR